MTSGALFVDFENVFYALLNEPFRLQRDDALAVALEAIQGVRKHFRDDGHALIVERSYADWDQIPENAQRQLQISGVLPRYADSRVDKNTADIELSLDILQHILTQPESQQVVLIGGDRDYLPILRRIKEQHRHICVCSLRKCLSGDVREFVSNYSLAKIVELDPFARKSDTGWRHQSHPPPVESQTSATADGSKPSSEVSGAAANSNGRQGAPGATNGSPEQDNRVDPLPSPKLETANTGSDSEIDPWEAILGDEYWQELYLGTMLRFLSERSYTEIFLGPFFRWLNTERVFESMSNSEQRKIFNGLHAQGMFRVEEREGFPHPFSVAVMNWNHPAVQKLNAREKPK